MRIKHKYFPYPIIAEDNNSYIDTRFITDATAIKEGYNIKFQLEASVNNPGICALIEDESIAFVHHIECAQTCFRTAVSTYEEKFDYIIPDSKVNGLVEVCSFLIAMKDIKNYSNNAFGTDYKGFKFDLDKGCIMGIGSQIAQRINKDRDDLANTSSIFSIIANFDPNEKNVRVDVNRKTKIVIRIPNDSFNRYKTMSSLLILQPVMHQMIILPALMYVLEYLKASKTELYNFEDYRWFRALRKTMKKFNITLDEPGLTAMDTYQMAQQLLNTPLTRALVHLSGGEEDYYED